MKVEELIPRPKFKEPFALSSAKFIPEIAGCYVLSTIDGTVLYVGLANSLRRRQKQHLESSGKVEATVLGRASFFNWLETEDINRVERTWLNCHVHSEGSLPILNKIYSPTN